MTIKTAPTDAMNLPPNGPGIQAPEAAIPALIDSSATPKQEEAGTELAHKAKRSMAPHRSERPHAK